MKSSLILIIIYSSALILKAQKVDTVSIYSQAMHRYIPTVVIQPIRTKATIKLALPTVYMLHGYSGNYSNWVTLVPNIKRLANTYQCYIICPDGGYSSWYFDSPIDSNYQYQTYICKELPNYIDAHYNTKKTAKARAITGLSMGGHGAIYAGLQYPNVYGALGSTSGALEVNYLKTKYDVKLRLGDTATYANNWRTHSMLAMIDTLKTNKQAIILDCGIDDYVLPLNEMVHRKLLKYNISHDYIIRPGKHNWEYWSNAIAYQMLFFSIYFEKNN